MRPKYTHICTDCPSGPMFYQNLAAQNHADNFHHAVHEATFDENGRVVDMNMACLPIRTWNGSRHVDQIKYLCTDPECRWGFFTSIDASVHNQRWGHSVEPVEMQDTRPVDPEFKTPVPVVWKCVEVGCNSFFSTEELARKHSGENLHSIEHLNGKWYLSGHSDVARPILTEPMDLEFDPEMVNHPKHYNEHPSGVECIEIVRHMNFNLGSAVKYLWRCGLKDDEIQELEKAKWYIEDEINRRKALI